MVRLFFKYISPKKFFLFLCIINYIQNCCGIEQISFVEQFCKTYQGPSENQKFVKDLSEKIFSNEEKRSFLFLGLSKGELPNCKKALQDYVERMINANQGEEDTSGLQNLIYLAATAQVNHVDELIIKYLDSGTQNEWLDVLKSLNPSKYESILNEKIHTLAEEIRKKEHSPVGNSNDYGKAMEENFPVSQTFSSWNPFLINTYFKEKKEKQILSHEKISTQELHDMNIIYGSLNQGHRELLKDDFILILKANSITWIECFRKEPLWLEFKLLPLMGNVKDGYTRRELIWLSHFHRSEKIKSLAIYILEGLS